MKRKEIEKRHGSLAARFGVAFCLALVALGAALTLSGCGSANSSKKPGSQVLRAGQVWDNHELDLTDIDERRIEAEARFAAGVMAELADAPDAALDYYKASLASDPDHERLALEVAGKLVELRRLDEARELLEKSARRPGASGMVWGWLGLIYSLQNNQPAAINANQEAIRRMPRNVRGYQNLAQIYLAAGQVASALAVLDEAAHQPDTDSAFLLSLAETMALLQPLKDPAVADLGPKVLELLDRAAALQPERPGDRLRIADLYERMGAEDKSLPIYQELVETEPDLPGLRERLTDIYLRTDNKVKAAEQLRMLARNQPTNPLPHYYLGRLALEAKQFEEAVSAFNQLLVLRPDNVEIYYDLAIAHLSHQRPQDALAVLERARIRFRPSFQLEYYTGAALADMKRYDDAVRHYMAAEVIAGATAPGLLTHLFYFQSGIAYERSKRLEDAATQFEKSLEIEPDFAEALNYLGYMWAEQGTNLERALELIQKAVQLEPENEAFLDSLAWVLHQLGRSEEALPHQLQSIALSKEPDAVLYEHLGDIYQRLGRRDEARQAWQKAQSVEAKPEVEKKLQEPLPQ